MNSKLSDLLGNISGLAALAIIVLAVVGVGVSLVAPLVGITLPEETLTLVGTFVSLLIGLAVGAGANGSALAVRSIRAMEMNSMSARDKQSDARGVSGELDRSTELKAKGD